MTDSTLTMRVEHLERRLRLHQRITAGAALILAAAGAAAFQSKDTTARFTELTVERLNVVRLPR